MDEPMETENDEESSDIDSDNSDDVIFDGGKWIKYRAGIGSAKNKEPFDVWLSKHTPTTVLKSDGFAWIDVSNYEMNDLNSCPDVDGLMESWEQFLSSDRQVDFPHIKELACNHNVLSGKWLFFAESGGKIDHFWSLVAKSIVAGSYPCKEAKVSAYDSNNERHVVCIYNEDFTDRDQVLLAEQAVRNMGIKCELLYKPDVYTYVGVYAKNPWNLRPNILKSVFDLKTGKSVIQSFIPD